MKKQGKKLLLNRETVRKLSNEELGGRVAGAGTVYECASIAGSLRGSIKSLSGSVVTGTINPDYLYNLSPEDLLRLSLN